MAATITLFDKSLEVANDILMESENLSNTDVTAEMYKERIPYLTNLLGEEGKVSFHPFVAKDIKEDFKKLVDSETDQKRRAYQNFLGTDEAEKTIRDAYYLSSELIDRIKDTDLIANTIPQGVTEYIKNYEVKGYNSPKLSKLLVKLYGEGSDVVKWFTNDCPKNLDKGLNKDYRIHLSILPHHIVGMSYYAPYNFDGPRWVTGWSGTSCMDTKRNSTGGGIYQLPPSLLDSTLAIAYLTTSHNEDDTEPHYLARTLVRVAKVNQDDYVMLGARAFYTNNETKNILIEGLKSEFENFVHADDLRKGYNVYKNRSFLTDINTGWDVNSARETCDDCDGDEGGCSSCDYDGYIEKSETYHPYIDDADLVTITDEGIQVRLPNKWLEEMGYIEKEVSPTLGFGYLAC